MKSRNKFTLCRLCLCENEFFTNIFELNDWQGYVAAEVISTFLQIQVHETDGYPHVVCSKCLTKLTDFKLFKECCLKSKDTYDNMFISSVGLGKVKPEIQIGDGGSSGSELCEEDPLRESSPDEIGDGGSSGSELCEEDPLREASPDPLIKQEKSNVDFASGDGSEKSFEGTNTEACFGPIILKHEVLQLNQDSNLHEKLIESEEFQNTDAVEPGVIPHSTQHERAIYYHTMDKIEKAVELADSDGGDDGLEFGINVQDYQQNTKASRTQTAKGNQDKMTSTKDEINVLGADHTHRFSCTSSMSTKCLEHEATHCPPRRATCVESCTRNISIHNESKCNNSSKVSLSIEAEASSCVTEESMEGQEISPRGGIYMAPLLERDEGIGKEREDEETEEDEVGRKRTAPEKEVIGETEKLKCYHCGDILLTKLSLIEHMRVHGFNNSCDSDVCDKVFQTNYNLRRHVLTQKKREDQRTGGKVEAGRDTTPREGKKQRLECYHCGNISATKVGLIRHMKVHGFGSFSDCEFCGKTFRSNYLKRHILTHTGSSLHKCVECNKLLTSKSSLTRHMRLHTGSKPYKCAVCSKCFSDTCNLRSHMRSHTGSENYKCLECNKHFTQRCSLKTHMRLHTGSKPYKCEECSKCFSDKSHFRKHIRIHTGYKPYKCKECSQLFSQSSTLNTHMKTHSDCKPYKCGVCSKCFRTNGNLKVHMSSHTGLKPYNCTKCSKCFSRTDALTVHMRSHTGLKPIKCAECDKGFSSNGNLKVHMRTHTGEKPYKCAECNRSFSFSSSHKLHMRTHTGCKPFTCGTCSKSFSILSYLKHHLLVHTKEKPFECHNCGMRFSQGGSLNKHLEEYCKGCIKC